MTRLQPRNCDGGTISYASFNIELFHLPGLWASPKLALDCFSANQASGKGVNPGVRYYTHSDPSATI